jgi:hypothetical protein
VVAAGSCDGSSNKTSAVPALGALSMDVVSQMGDPVALDDLRVAEESEWTVVRAEEPDALAKHYRDQVNLEFVH